MASGSESWRHGLTSRPNSTKLFPHVYSGDNNRTNLEGVVRIKRKSCTHSTLLCEIPVQVSQQHSALLWGFATMMEHRRRWGREPGGDAALAWGRGVPWPRPQLIFWSQPHTTVLTTQMPGSSTSPAHHTCPLVSTGTKNSLPAQVTSKNSLCLVHWEWCRLEMLQHSHPLWNLHHTCLQRPPCSLEDKKRKHQYRNVNPQFSKYISAHTKAHYHRHDKPEFLVLLLLVLKRKNFKVLYSSLFTQSEKRYFYSCPLSRLFPFFITTLISVLRAWII